MSTIEASKRIICALALCAALSTTILAQGLPGGSDDVTGAGWDVMDYQMSHGMCSASCWSVHGSVHDPSWGGIKRGPLGTQTGGFGGIVRWDQDGDGDAETPDMNAYEITVKTLKSVADGNGDYWVVFEIVLVHKQTGEEHSVESHAEQITAQQILGANP